MARVYAVGELLIDFTAMEENVSVQEAKAFAKHPGGAPANAAVAVARLGGQSAFVGCVGHDPFGEFLVDALRAYQVNVDYVERTTESPTTLAFVARRSGEPDYCFVRSPGADVFLSEKMAETLPLTASDVVHMGSNSLAEEPIYSSVKRIATRIGEAGGWLSLDVNLRPAFWSEPELAKARLAPLLPEARLVKCNEAELLWLTGESDLEAALRAIRGRTEAVVICTLGGSGSLVSAPQWQEPLRVEGFRVQAVDATGAGDTFIGAILYQLQKDRVQSSDLYGLDEQQWTTYIQFASAAAAISVTRTGAMTSMPTRAEVLGFMGK